VLPKHMRCTMLGSLVASYFFFSIGFARLQIILIVGATIDLRLSLFHW